MRSVYFLLLIGALACSPASDETLMGHTEEPDSLAALATPDDYNVLATPSAEILFALQAPDRTPVAPVDTACVFQHSRRFPTHLEFLRAGEGGERLAWDVYEALALRRATRAWWLGSLRYWPTLPHPTTGQFGVYTFTLVEGPTSVDRPAPGDIVAAADQLRECAPLVAQRLAFLPASPESQQQLEEHGDPLADAGLPWLSSEGVVADDTSEILTAGVGYGFLRQATGYVSADDFGPQDVLVSATLPPDLGRVAALITLGTQSASAPLAQRLAAAGIPNAVAPQVLADPAVAALVGRLVRVDMTGDDVRIAPASASEAEAHWATIRPSITVPTPDLTVRAMEPLQRIRYAHAVAYGSHAGGLGELRHVLLAGATPNGFGVPFVHYQEFVERTSLSDSIAALMANPQLGTDATRRKAALQALRAQFMAEPLPEGFTEQLVAAVEASFGPGADTRRLLVRGSANLADLGHLTGSGVQGARPACLADDLDNDDLGPSRCLTTGEVAGLQQKLAEWTTRRAAADPADHPWMDQLIGALQQALEREWPLSDAVRGVWARAWTDRGWAERSWYGIEQTDVLMGLVVSAAFVAQQLDAVAVTNLPGAEAPLYRVLTVPGDALPQPLDPTAVAEILTFERDREDQPTVLVPSSQSSSPLWRPEHLTTLAERLFQVQDHFQSHGLLPAPVHLEVHAKLTSAGQVVLTQVRPYAQTLADR